MSRTTRRLLLALVLLPILSILGLVVYLKLSDFSGWRGTVARLASERIGREITISGRFEAEVGGITRLVVEDVALANPDWSTERVMAQADRLEISFDLWTLAAGPLRIREAHIRGATLRLEKDAGDRGNWQFPAAGAGDEPRGPTGLVVEVFTLEDAELGFHGPSVERPVEASVERLRARLTETDLIELDLEADFRGTALELAASVGPLAGLEGRGLVEHELTGHFGDVELAVRGTTVDLARLAEPELEIEMHGPDVATVTGPLGLPSLGSGPFRLSGGISPSRSGGPLEVRLDASLGEMEMRATGRTSSLTDPRELDLTLDAAGPDLAAAGSLAHIAGLPARPFVVSGRLRRSASEIAFEGVTVRLGEDRLLLDGVLSAAPDSVGSKVTIEAEGRDLSVFSALARVDLPAGPYQVRGRLARRAEGIFAEELAARIGSTTARLNGSLGSLPGFAGAEIDFRLVSPEPAIFKSLAGFRLPSEPLAVEGHLGYREDTLALESVVVQAAESRVRLDGILRPSSRFAGTDLVFRAAGPELARLAALAPPGLPELPPERFDVGGRVRVLGGKLYELDGVEGRVGETSLEVDGRLHTRPGLDGTDLRLHVAGTDLSRWGDLAGRPGLPAQPFEVSGRLGIESGLYRLDEVAGEVGRHRAAVSGVVGSSSDPSALELVVDLAGPDAREAARFVSQVGLAGLPELPGDAYSLSGALGRIDSGYRLGDVVLTLGGLEGRVDGKLVIEPGTSLAPPDGEPAAAASSSPRWLSKLAGTELTLDLSGPDASIAGAMAGVEVSPQAFRARGRVELRQTEARFDGVRAELGEHRIELEGTLGGAPQLSGTRLEVRASGPDKALLAGLLGDPGWLPDEPYEVTGRFEGDPQNFRVPELRLQVGPSDLAGSLRLDRRGKPELRAELRSERLDLTTLLGAATRAETGTRAGRPEAGGGQATSPAGQRQRPGESKLVTSNDPVVFEVLNKLDAEVRYAVAEVTIRAGSFRNVELRAHLRDGRLRLERSSVEGPNLGSFSTELTLEPVARGYRLFGQATAAGVRLLGLTPDRNAELAVPLDLELRMDGSGDSLHALASSLDGHLIATLGKGQIDFAPLAFLAEKLPVLGLLARLLGPGELLLDRADYTGVECGVLVAVVEDGVVELDPAALRLDYQDVGGLGRLDLESEELDLRWTTRGRGLRVDLTSVGHRFIKLGGTLAEPRVEARPLEAAADSWLALSTGGLSWASEGLWKRLADRKLCKKALKVAIKARAAIQAGGHDRVQ